MKIVSYVIYHISVCNFDEQNSLVTIASREGGSKIQHRDFF